MFNETVLFDHYDGFRPVVSETGIFKAADNLLTDKKLYNKMSKAINPYGDGKAAKRIVKVINEKNFN